jgi:hypothetical protein
MRYPSARILLSVALGMLLAMSLAMPVSAGEKVNKDADDVAILGYDAVAYFTEGGPVEGRAEFEHQWHESRWRFASARHRDLFAGDPERYAPRYGGFCAGGMASGWVLPIDPSNWAIVEGRLYLAYARQGSDALRTDPDPLIAKADANWERLGQTE